MGGGGEEGDEEEVGDAAVVVLGILKILIAHSFSCLRYLPGVFDVIYESLQIP